MTYTLRYRQGSFLLEKRCSTLEETIALAHDLKRMQDVSGLSIEMAGAEIMGDAELRNPQLARRRTDGS